MRVRACVGDEALSTGKPALLRTWLVMAMMPDQHGAATLVPPTEYHAPDDPSSLVM